MIRFLRPIYYEAVKHVYKIVVDVAYRKYWFLEAKLRKIPRFTPCHAKVHGWDLSIPDSASFLSAYKEIFVEQMYAFKFKSSTPKILDLGANIGLSVLFFKLFYPNAEITAFEPDPKIFEYLKKNVHGNGYTDVQLINKAAWYENTTLKFNAEGADGGRVALADDINLVEIDAINIAEFLRSNQFDFLKMDIEGAEDLVLPACKEFLIDIKYVFVEYHSENGKKQHLDRIISTLVDAGFRIYIYSVIYSPSPFIEIKTNANFDLQLNIFGWRE